MIQKKNFRLFVSFIFYMAVFTTKADPVTIGVSSGNPKSSVDIKITTKGGPDILQNLSFDRTKPTGGELDRVAGILNAGTTVEATRSSEEKNGETVELLTITPKPGQPNYTDIKWAYSKPPKEQPFDQFGVKVDTTGPGQSSLEIKPGGLGALDDFVDWTLLVAAQDFDLVVESTLLDVSNLITPQELTSLFALDLGNQGFDVFAMNNILTLNSDMNEFFLLDISGEPSLLFELSNSAIPEPTTIAFLGTGLAGFCFAHRKKLI